MAWFGDALTLKMENYNRQDQMDGSTYHSVRLDCHQIICSRPAAKINAESKSFLKHCTTTTMVNIPRESWNQCLNLGKVDRDSHLEINNSITRSITKRQKSRFCERVGVTRFYLGTGFDITLRPVIAAHKSNIITDNLDVKLRPSQIAKYTDFILNRYYAPGN